MRAYHKLDAGRFQVVDLRALSGIPLVEPHAARH
jgi:hypothetical protein